MWAILADVAPLLTRDLDYGWEEPHFTHRDHLFPQVRDGLSESPKGLTGLGQWDWNHLTASRPAAASVLHGLWGANGR